MNIVIFGDSVIKHLKGYEMSEIVGVCKMVVKSFERAEVWCISLSFLIL